MFELWTAFSFGKGVAACQNGFAVCAVVVCSSRSSRSGRVVVVVVVVVVGGIRSSADACATDTVGTVVATDTTAAPVVVGNTVAIVGSASLLQDPAFWKE